jgi:hypothetical protein
MYATDKLQIFRKKSLFGGRGLSGGAALGGRVKGAAKMSPEIIVVNKKNSINVCNFCKVRTFSDGQKEFNKCL